MLLDHAVPSLGDKCCTDVTTDELVMLVGDREYFSLPMTGPILTQAGINAGVPALTAGFCVRKAARDGVLPGIFNVCKDVRGSVRRG